MHRVVKVSEAICPCTVDNILADCACTHKLAAFIYKITRENEMRVKMSM